MAVLTGPGDAYIEVTDPSRNVIGSLKRPISAVFKIYEFGTGEAEIVVPLDEPLLAVGGAYTSGLSGYGFRMVYRGQTFFDGICHTIDDEDAEDEGHALEDLPINVTIRCVTWLDWFLGGRQMKGSGRARFSQNDKADNVLKAMLRANMVSGGTPSLITPPEYTAGLYDPITDTSGLSASRTNFGNSWTIAVAANTGAHSDTVFHRWDSGRSLSDQVREFCRRYDVGLSGSWSGTTYTISTAATAAGTDRTATVKFTRENGGLRHFRRSRDRLSPSNVCEVAGIGRRANQVVKYAINKTFYDDVGLREMGAEVWHSADATDAQNEVRFLVSQVNGYLETREVTIGEITGQTWGDPFTLGDKITVYCSRRAVTVEDYIHGAELNFSAPGPWDLRILVGRPPMNADKASRRSGGGGGGGGHGGGHPKGTSGESEIDPDDINSYAYLEADVGGTTDAESANHYAKIHGYDTTTYVRARTHATDSGASDSSGTPDRLAIEIRGNIVDGEVVHTGTVRMRNGGAGNDILLLAREASPAP